jgi:hypothetical protein
MNPSTYEKRGAPEPTDDPAKHCHPGCVEYGGVPVRVVPVEQLDADYAHSPYANNAANKADYAEAKHEHRADDGGSERHSYASKICHELCSELGYRALGWCVLARFRQAAVISEKSLSDPMAARQEDPEKTIHAVR